VAALNGNPSGLGTFTLNDRFPNNVAIALSSLAIVSPAEAEEGAALQEVGSACYFSSLVRLIVFALLSFSLVGCSAHPSKEKLVGKYVLRVSTGTDSIDLKDDGTYIHRFQCDQGTSATQNGRWELENLEAGPTVTLDDFRPLLRERIRGQGFYLLTVRSFLGKITLITNPDLNEGYERED
jgi:hypothetical protein